VQENHYDPWGMNLVGIEMQGRPDHKFQYNGIEKQEEFGLNVDMALYRTLDPQLGRWWQVDPEVQNFESLTPYNSNFNNPIRYDDPLGDCPCLALALPAIGEALIYVGGAVVASGAIAGVIELAKNADLSAVGPQYSNPAVSAAQSLRSQGESIKAPDEVAAPKVKVTDENGRVNARGKNKTVPDTGTPNAVARNKPGTTYKKYGPDGVVQKEFNKGHNGMGTPKKEKVDHVHDHKPKPNRHPNDPQPTDRQRGRTPKKNELKRDFGI
jgi:RHS repeat-associated protein